MTRRRSLLEEYASPYTRYQSERSQRGLILTVSQQIVSALAKAPTRDMGFCWVSFLNPTYCSYN